MIKKSTASKGAMISILLASMLTMMAGAVMAPALPEIAENFNWIPNYKTLTNLILTVHGLAIAIFSFIIGKAVDKIGRLPVLFSSLILYFVAGTAGFYLENLYMILITRFILGIAVAGIMTSAITLIGDYYKGDKRNQVMGFQGAFMGVGGVMFISMSGILADVNWHTPFLLYAFSLPFLIFCWLFLIEPTKKTLAVRYEKSDNSTGFNPFILIIILSSSFIATAFFFMLPVYLPQILIDKVGVSSRFIGLALAASTLSSSVVAMRIKWIRRVMNYPSMYLFSFLFMGLGYLLISMSSTYYQFIGALIVSGIGMGLLMPAGNLWMIAVAPQHKRGRLIGLLSSFTFFGQFASPIIFQPLINATSAQETFLITAIMQSGLVIFFLVFHFWYTPKIARKIELK